MIGIHGFEGIISISFRSRLVPIRRRRFEQAEPDHRLNLWKTRQIRWRKKTIATRYMLRMWHSCIFNWQSFSFSLFLVSYFFFPYKQKKMLHKYPKHDHTLKQNPKMVDGGLHEIETKKKLNCKNIQQLIGDGCTHARTRRSLTMTSTTCPAIRPCWSAILWTS